MDFEEAVEGIINFVRVDDGLVFIYDKLSETTYEEHTVDTNADILTYFNKMFEPFYALLLNEMNRMREMRNEARHNGSNGSRIGRPVNEGQPSTYQRTHYNNCFSTPFTRDNLN